MTTTDSQSSGERPLTGETPPRSATTPPGDGFETGNPPDEAAVATETPKGFTLYWWAILAWIALIAVHAAATFGGLVDVPVEDDGRVAYWLGGSVGAGLIVMLIAWVVYRASKNLLASNTVFTVLVLLGTMGQAYVRLDDFNAAERIFRRLLELDDESSLAYNGLARVSIAGKRFDEAVDYALRAVGLPHQYPRAHYNLGVALAETGRVGQAIQALQTCVGMAPGMGPAHFWLAKLLAADGRDPEQARKHDMLARQCAAAAAGEE